MQNNLIPNNILGLNPNLNGTLGLTQIDSFEPVTEFKDKTQCVWKLVKSAFNSSIEIPNPKCLQITDYWNHIYPNLSEQVYVYAVEGIKQPTVETEKPVKILYQWFSLKNVPNFLPTMITESEWKRANVYASEIEDTRMSKLLALCRIESIDVPTVQPDKSDNQLIKLGKNEPKTK